MTETIVQEAIKQEEKEEVEFKKKNISVTAKTHALFVDFQKQYAKEKQRKPSHDECLEDLLYFFIENSRKRE